MRSHFGVICKSPGSTETAGGASGRRAPGHSTPPPFHSWGDCAREKGPELPLAPANGLPHVQEKPEGETACDYRTGAPKRGWGLCLLTPASRACEALRLLGSRGGRPPARGAATSGKGQQLAGAGSGLSHAHFPSRW